MISLLRAGRGVRELEDSSGNGGSSVAAYCAAAGIRARILVPERRRRRRSCRPGRTAPTSSWCRGDRDATADEALRQSAPRTTPATTGTPSSSRAPRPSPTSCGRTWLHRARRRGARWPVPAPPCSAATSASASCWPRARSPGGPGCWSPSPPTAPPSTPRSTAGAPPPPSPDLAEGTAIREPVRLPEVVDAIRRSGGDMAPSPRTPSSPRSADWPPGAVRRADQRDRGRRDRRLPRHGAIRPGETTVVVLTGSGLKSAAAMGTLFASRITPEGGEHDDRSGDEEPRRAEDELLLREAEKIVTAIGRMFPGLCEVVLHDLRRPDQAIRAIESNLSGRSVGDSGHRTRPRPHRGPRLPRHRPELRQPLPGRPPGQEHIHRHQEQRGHLRRRHLPQPGRLPLRQRRPQPHNLVRTDDQEQPLIESLRARTVTELRTVVEEFAAARGHTPRGLGTAAKKELVRSLQTRGLPPGQALGAGGHRTPRRLPRHGLQLSARTMRVRRLSPVPPCTVRRAGGRPARRASRTRCAGPSWATAARWPPPCRTACHSR